jgi:hypothetical protein
MPLVNSPHSSHFQAEPSFSFRRTDETINWIYNIINKTSIVSLRDLGIDKKKNKSKKAAEG